MTQIEQHSAAITQLSIACRCPVSQESTLGDWTVKSVVELLSYPYLIGSPSLCCWSWWGDLNWGADRSFLGTDINKNQTSVMHCYAPKSASVTHITFTASGKGRSRSV